MNGATLKGMALTFKHLVDPRKVTLQYPDEKPALSPRWRGRWGSASSAPPACSRVRS